MHPRPFTVCAWLVAACCAPGCGYDFDAPFAQSYWSGVDAAADVGSSEASDVGVSEGGDADGPNPDGDAGEGGACAPSLKRCDGRCVLADDPDYGCAPDTCAPCELAHATAACAENMCAVASCSSDWGDCNDVPADGCEQSLRTLQHCGACGEECTVTTGQATCATGSCTIDNCDPLTADCDSNPTNGCETALTSIDNCGACAVPCEIAHANASCGGGVCQPVGCDYGWGDCDNNASNGCESSLLTDADGCGACGEPCSFTHVASRDCSSGLCLPSCDNGWGDCNGPEPGGEDDGCETYLSFDVDNCGGCGNACSLPVSGASTGIAECNGGSCAVSCEQGYSGCPSASGTVCVDTSSDPRFCGSSCVPCQPGSTCKGGTCVPDDCAPGLTNCVGPLCHNLLTDESHCGACSSPCGGFCQDGICVSSCDAGKQQCAGGCVDFQTDPANCGGCGNMCSPGELCTAGQCEAFLYATGCWACGLDNTFTTCCSTGGVPYCLPPSISCL